MREFKFIRDKYTNENIFNSDETKACLFAYSKDGKLVPFSEKNNKEFQDKIALLSSDRLSEIYTLRPSQFTVSAEQTSSGFNFTYKANETAFNDDVEIPEAVRNSAESHIKSNTEVIFDTDKHLPNLNFEDSSNIVKTPTIFKFNDNNNNKEFSKNLVFKVSGFLKERGYTTAQGENITAYPKSDGKIDFGGKTGTNAKSGTFHQGILQTAAPTKTGTIYRNVATVSSAEGSLTLAKNYVASDGYRFIKDGSFETDIPYKDGLSFKLYSKVDGYLTAAEASDAVATTNTFAIEGDKYKKNNAGEYEYDSGANANYNVQYYLIQAGSSASGTKLRKSSSSPEKYSVISSNDYYFVDDTMPSKGFSSLGFQTIDYYKGKANTTEMSIQENPKTVGSGKVAFIKVDGVWQAVSSDGTITKKYFTTITEDGASKKVNLVGIIKSDTGMYTLTRADKGQAVTFDKSTVIEAEYYYNTNTLFTDYREFTATTAASQDKFINFNSLDNIVNSTGITEDVDYGNIYTPVVAEITTSYTVNAGYVAYDKNETLTELIDGSNATVTVYERDTTKEKDISSLDYDFYYVNSGDAYMLKGECNVGARANNQFVEGYTASYENYYIFKNNKLSNILATDLSDKDTITYYESKDHHIIGNGVYDDDDDGKKYVMFSNNWVEGIAINSENTLVNEYNVPAPNTTENVLRLITEVNVNATESD